LCCDRGHFTSHLSGEAISEDGPIDTLDSGHLVAAEQGGSNPVNTTSGGGVIEETAHDAEFPLWRTWASNLHEPVPDVRDNDEASAHGIRLEREVVGVISSGNITTSPAPSVNVGALSTPASRVSGIPISAASPTTIVARFTCVSNFFGLGIGSGLMITVIPASLILLLMFSICRGWSAFSVGLTHRDTVVGWR